MLGIFNVRTDVHACDCLRGLYGYVPAGSPSRGGDVTVYVLDISQPSLPPLFVLFLYLFLSLWPFQLYFIPLNLSTTLRFLTLFFWSHSALLVLSTIFHLLNSPDNSSLSHSVLLVLLCLIGPFNYVSLYESLTQP